MAAWQNSQANIGYDNHNTVEDDEVLRNEDLAGLFLLCGEWQDEQSQEGIDSQWEEVREWFKEHSAQDAHDAALLMGESNVTSLHLACKYQCPVDIVTMLLQAAPETVKVEDSHGWLPLHYAAANLANDKVLQVLVETYPESTSIGDLKGRTPLHFSLSALNAKENEMSTTRARLLSTGKANRCPDNVEGMLPFHIACAFGVPVEVLEVLIEGYTRDYTGAEKELEAKNIVNKQSSNGKIPLHFACVNSAFYTSPSIVDFLVDLDPNTVNITDDEQFIPLRRLAVKAKEFKDDSESRGRIQKILDSYLSAKPHATADFLTAIQDLPDWLRDRAVITPTVQETLNKKISRRFPTAIILLDLMGYFCIIIAFSFGVTLTIKILAMGYDDEGESDERRYLMVCIWFILIPSFYFLTREFIQVLSFMSMGILKTWFLDPSNYLDSLTFGFGFYFGIFMWDPSPGKVGEPHPALRNFRWSASVALLVFWCTFLSFLRSISIDFAVFVGGLTNVVSRLVAFLFALVIILVAFAEIFVLIYFDSNICTLCSVTDKEDKPWQELLRVNGGDVDMTDYQGKKLCLVEDFEGDFFTAVDGNFDSFNHFCNFRWSIMKVYTMLLGEVNDEDFFVKFENYEELNKTSTTEVIGIIYFTLFMFLVVILLANVLIAIVTDSYGVIKNERAAIVFWSNRLDFVTEMDAIFHVPFRDMMRGCLFLPAPPQNKPESKRIEVEETFGRSLWKTLTHDVTNQADDLKCLSIDFLVYACFRLVVMFFICLWLPFGFLTMGALWPPQVRSFIWTQRSSRNNQGEVKELEQRSIEVKALREEVKDLQDEIVLEMTADRREVVAMKTQFKNMKYDLQNEMKDIKQIVMMLFDLQASADI